MAAPIEKFTEVETPANRSTKLNKLLEYIAKLEERLAALES